MKLYVSGTGRMGQALSRLCGEEGFGLGALDDADAIVDYSHPDWTGPLLRRLLERPRPVVIGTTGLPDEQVAAIDRLAERTAVVLAPNTGTGIAVLRRLVAAAAAALPGWDVEILELHHRRKLDAPSGTAWALLDDAAAARGADRRVAVPARVGAAGARTDAEIGVAALRGGDVVGEHTVYLVGPGERIELTHRAWDRDTFARGGLRAARWALDAPPGRYGMADVLG